jgi:hypothetical protein
MAKAMPFKEKIFRYRRTAPARCSYFDTSARAVEHVRPERSMPRFGVARRSARNSWRSSEAGAAPSPSRGGLGWGWGKSGSDTAIGTHPPPDLPLEGGGATVIWAPLRRSPGKPRALPVLSNSSNSLTRKSCFLRGIEGGEHSRRCFDTSARTDQRPADSWPGTAMMDA